MKQIRNNKKGTLRDILLFGVIISVLSIGLFFSYYSINLILNTVATNPVIAENNASAEAFLSPTEKVTPRFDYIISGVVMGLLLALIISAWFISGNTLFMFIYFVIDVIAVILAAIMANVWEDISQASLFGTTVLAFPITNHLMSNLPYYVAIAAVIGMIAMFAKPDTLK